MSSFTWKRPRDLESAAEHLVATFAVDSLRTRPRQGPQRNLQAGGGLVPPQSSPTRVSG
jgi:hypothetical protein